MNDEQTALMTKAEERLRAARLLAENGFLGPATSEAYYAMFDATKALLIAKDVLRHKHGSAIAAFGEHFVKTGIFDRTMHRNLLAAERDRLAADYQATADVSAETVAGHIANAQAFIAAARRHLGKT